MRLKVTVGAHDVEVPRPSLAAGALSLGAGALGALLWKKHPVLGFFGASAIASNAHAVVTKQRTLRKAAEQVGRHFVATAGSLALPSHPAIGYIAAAVAAELLLDKDGGLLIDWAHYSGVIDSDAVPKSAIDVTPVRELTKRNPGTNQVA